MLLWSLAFPMNYSSKLALFCLCSSQISRILYSVMIDGFMTFPANDPVPDLAAVTSAVMSAGLAGVSVFEGDVSQLAREEDHFYITLAGILSSSMKVTIETDITTAWADVAGNIDVVCQGKLNNFCYLCAVHMNKPSFISFFLCTSHCKTFINYRCYS